MVQLMLPVFHSRSRKCQNAIINNLLQFVKKKQNSTEETSETSCFSKTHFLFFFDKILNVRFIIFLFYSKYPNMFLPRDEI